MSCVHLRDVRSPIRRAHLNAKGGLDASRGPIHWDADLQSKHYAGAEFGSNVRLSIASRSA